MVKGRPGKTKKDPKNAKGDLEEDDEDEADIATPKAVAKGSAKLSTTKSNRRKSGRRR